MIVNIKHDGSVDVKTNSYEGYYDRDGYFKFVIGNLDAPKKLTINIPNKIEMTELDKLEEQLTHIKKLMQDIGVKSESARSVSGDAVFGGVLTIDKLEQGIKTQLAELHRQADRQDAIITELMQAREAERQAWSKAMSELNNRTWCSQK
ncbi:hypothetical protein [Proteus sp. PR00224]|uniref:hypothetical protein n=1 Tax=Proteus sp. PR00224 TaxID=2794026 RepID=UPI0018E48ACA|nr:hypothetical protein [Proteus sp. PR00224]MBI6340218.1 hypothetical protein [Proteus sp. PR00224]